MKIMKNEKEYAVWAKSEISEYYKEYSENLKELKEMYNNGDISSDSFDMMENNAWDSFNSNIESVMFNAVCRGCSLASLIEIGIEAGWTSEEVENYLYNVR